MSNYFSGSELCISVFCEIGKIDFCTSEVEISNLSTDNNCFKGLHGPIMTNMSLCNCICLICLTVWAAAYTVFHYFAILEKSFQYI